MDRGMRAARRDGAARAPIVAASGLGAGILGVAAVIALAALGSGPAHEVARAAGPEQAGHAGHAEHAARPEGVREPGDAAFAAIREVVARLERDPETDWTRVDLEALRLHLRDMRNFTLNVEVIAREDVPDGVRFRVRGIDAAAHESLGRALDAHPRVLREEMGWAMAVRRAGDAFDVTVTSDRPADVPKLRGLGYIGVMATGEHHTAHHLAIATGGSPHSH